MSEHWFRRWINRVAGAFGGLQRPEGRASEVSLPALKQDFWECVMQALRSQQITLYPEATRPQSGVRFWTVYAVLPGCRYWMILEPLEVRVELSIESPNKAGNKQLFDYLHEQSAGIESRFGDSLSWQRLDDHTASRIRYSCASEHITEPEYWPELAQWLAQQSVNLDRAFRDALAGFADHEGTEMLIKKQPIRSTPKAASEAGLAPEEQLLPELRLDFWRETLAGLQEKEISLYQHARPGKAQFLSTKSGLAGCRYWMTFSNSEIRVELHIDREDRRQNKQIFDYLYQNKARVEQGFGLSLIWNRLESKQASKIRFYKTLQEGYDRHNWPEMIDWLAEHIVRLEKGLSQTLLDYQRDERNDPMETPKDHSEAAEHSGLDQQSLPGLRVLFWTEVLADLRTKDSLLYRNTSPAKAYFFSTKSPLNGCRYWMTFGQSEIRVELNIDRQGKVENKRIFNYLHRQKKKIEERFEKALSWDKLPDKKVSKIRLSQPVNAGYSQANWPAMVAWLSEHIIRLEQALSPALINLVKQEAEKKDK